MVKPLLRLSQAQLQLLEICPPQFQRRYLEQRYQPVDPQQQIHQQWGDRFHRLMQQWQAGLPLPDLSQSLPDLGQSLSALIACLPPATPQQQRAVEHQRFLQCQGYALTVIYDLLILEPGRAEIVDWKTYPQPPSLEPLQQHWQTCLYLYVLAETSDYEPDQLSMTYWFVKLPRKPQSVTFPYSQKAHQATAQRLQKLLDLLDHWLPQAQDFPHRPDCQQNCPYAAPGDGFRGDQTGLTEKLDEGLYLFPGGST